jgi:hypothetical protein
MCARTFIAIRVCVAPLQPLIDSSTSKPKMCINLNQPVKDACGATARCEPLTGYCCVCTCACPHVDVHRASVAVPQLGQACSLTQPCATANAACTCDAAGGACTCTCIASLGYEVNGVDTTSCRRARQCARTIQHIRGFRATHC